MNLNIDVITELFKDDIEITNSSFYFDGLDLSFYEKNDNYILDLGRNINGYSFYFKDYTTENEILSDGITLLELQTSDMVSTIKSFKSLGNK